MALVQNHDFSLIPTGLTPEYARAKENLSVLARHFGFTELTVELEKYCSPQSKNFLDTFRRLGSPCDLVVTRFDEAVLSDDNRDFLRDDDMRQLKFNY
jgi:hypothetical protein